MTRSIGGYAHPMHRLLHALATLVAVLVLGGSAGLAAGVVVFHLGVRPVLTGSMRPTFGPGAILITRPVPVADLRKGMIPLFVPPGEHAEFAHRITALSGSPTDPVITTQGDANKFPDPWHAQLRTATVPVVVGTVPWIGRLMVGIRGPLQLVLIILGGTVAAVTGTGWILRRPRPVLMPA